MIQIMFYVPHVGEAEYDGMAADGKKMYAEIPS